LASIDHGRRVAVVLNVRRGHELPKYWHGVRVVDGDKSDARYKDPTDCIVGLRAKGRLIGSGSGMVRDV
jgi:hypothetical protein